jgi:hypothetical protein
MSACAGSLTEALGLKSPRAHTQVWLLCRPGSIRTARDVVSSISPAGPNGSRPAGQGLMSTQRRESRWRPIGCMDCADKLGLSSSAPLAWHSHAHASGGTAPPEVSARLATNSLQSDRQNSQLVRLVTMEIRRGSPPPGAGSRAHKLLGLRLKGLPPIPSPSGLARLHPSLPRVPAALSSRTERYDGKRDLHLQHAA